MRYKLLVPFRTNFSISSEYPIQIPKEYSSFWAGLEHNKKELKERIKPKDLEIINQINFSHKDQASPYNRYQKLDEDSLERTLHIIDFHLNKTQLFDILKNEIEEVCEKYTETNKDKDELLNTLNAQKGNTLEICEKYSMSDEDKTLIHLLNNAVWLNCWVFGYGTSIFEVDFKVDKLLQKETKKKEIENQLDNLQKVGIALGEFLGEKITNDFLNPVFTWIKKKEKIRSFIEPSENSNVKNDFSGKVFWVTRTIIFESKFIVNKEVIIRHWLKGTITSSLVKDKHAIDLIVKENTQYSVKWLSYLFRENSYPITEFESLNPFCDKWEGMIYAQYYYSAMEVVDLKLTRILAKSMSNNNRNIQISNLRKELENAIKDANFLLIEFHHNSKFYKRSVKSEMDKILKYWEFQKVLIEPVQHKINLCQQRLDFLHQKKIDNSSIFTDMILMGIGITAVIGLFLNLAQYGRTMAIDSDLASYDIESNFNIIDWFAVQPTDRLLIISFVVSFFLGILYYYKRKSQTL